MPLPERPVRNPAMFANDHFLRLTDGKPEEALDRFEGRVQELTIATLRNLGIRATVKRDKFSLPFTHEVISELRLESWLNAVYEYQWPLRKFVLELLNQNEDRIRFYLWVDFFETQKPRSGITGGLRYHFRYCVHTPPPPKFTLVPRGNVMMIEPKQ